MKLKQKFIQWWCDIQPFLKRTKEILSSRGGEGTVETCMEVFNILSQVLIGNQVFLVERHFTGHRDLREAIFTAVENEAAREESSEKTA